MNRQATDSPFCYPSLCRCPVFAASIIELPTPYSCPVGLQWFQTTPPLQCKYLACGWPETNLGQLTYVGCRWGRTSNETKMARYCRNCAWEISNVYIFSLPVFSAHNTRAHCQNNGVVMIIVCYHWLESTTDSRIHFCVVLLDICASLYIYIYVNIPHIHSEQI